MPDGPLSTEITVVAGVIECDGRVLICQRRRGSRHSLKWEFPGGKVEPGEALAAALRRELAEELGITAQVGAEIMRYSYQYPGRAPVPLVFIRVSGFEGEPRNLSCEQMRWVTAADLPQYDFLEGDREIVRVLAASPA
jgi:8-oxo-dGTP diphosphatase